MLLTRPLVFGGISFLTTALVVSFFSFNVSVAILICFVILLLIGLFVFKGKDRIGVLIILLSGILAVSSYMFFKKNSDYDLNRFDSKTGNITGVVTNIAPAKNSKTAYTIKVKATSIKDMPTGFKAILYTKSDAFIDYYDTIKINAKALKIKSSPAFDIKQYYRVNGIYLTFFSYNDVDVIKKGKHDIMYYAKHLNDKCCDVIDQYVERPYSGLMKAILLGNDSDMDDTAFNKILRAGVSHIFVVSGLHLSLIVTMLFFLLKLLKVSLKARSIATIIASWGFVAITGFGIPAIRSAIMLTILMGANLFSRPADSLTSLFLAGIIIVLTNPLAIVNGSFLLTFTATLGLILFARPISNYFYILFNVKKKAIKYIIDILAVTISANLVMLPVIIYIFKGISVISPLVGIIIVPLLPIVLIVGILLLIFSPIAFLANFFGGIVKLLLSFIFNVCKAASTFKFSYIGLNYNFVYMWIVITIILIIIATVLIREKKLTLNVLFISFAGLMLCFGFNSIYNRDNIEITTINTFKAQSVVITYDKRATVISFSDDNQIDVDVENYLRSKNIHVMENYIITDDQRKDITDTEFLTSAIDTYKVYLPQSNELFSYAKDIFKPINGVYGLKVDGGYDILSFKGTKISVDKYDNGEIISLIVGNTRVGITNSPEIASEANCEILFYSGEYNEKLTQIKSKCVILLNRFKLDRLADKFDCINAYEEQVHISLRQSGSYKIGV